MEKPGKNLEILLERTPKGFSDIAEAEKTECVNQVVERNGVYSKGYKQELLVNILIYFRNHTQRPQH